jgi:hypothetical protein
MIHLVIVNVIFIFFQVYPLLPHPFVTIDGPIKMITKVSNSFFKIIIIVVLGAHCDIAEFLSHVPHLKF